jgi:hypothetical protein
MQDRHNRNSIFVWQNEHAFSGHALLFNPTHA